MRTIVKERHLEFKVLEINPGTLLAANRHIASSDHGALATRFTVQYNLYAGSIVALGTQEQRELLYSTQEHGALGCFAFTETGAGVLTGAGVETTAHYDPLAKKFTITSPTLTSRKTWISQVLL
jgi:acyl-CoA oxidase